MEILRIVGIIVAAVSIRRYLGRRGQADLAARYRLAQAASSIER
jgi:hypothetical protein